MITNQKFVDALSTVYAKGKKEINLSLSGAYLESDKETGKLVIVYKDKKYPCIIK
jgi:hypothetical protein